MPLAEPTGFASIGECVRLRTDNGVVDGTESESSERNGGVRSQPHSRTASIPSGNDGAACVLQRSDGYGRRWSVSPPPAPGGHTSIVTIANAG